MVDENQGYFSGVKASEYDLPHPRISLPLIFIIRRAIQQAFTQLRERDFPLGTALEDEITIELHSIIENDLRQRGAVPGFDREVFDAVTRHHPVEDYQGKHPFKAPDLCFKLRGDYLPERVLSTHHALFVECKPVDSDHPAGSCYCDRGLQRFVDGQYAWAMEDALMLAFTRADRTISRHLVPAMQEQSRRMRLKICHPPMRTSNPTEGDDPLMEPLHMSCHRRDFAYPNGKGKATDIRVYHSWHRCG